MYLGGTGCAATAVTACSAAQKDNDISGVRGFSDNILSGCRTHYRTDFHTLCHVIRVIDFLYKARCQTNLVAVGGISCRRTADQLLLRKLSL